MSSFSFSYPNSPYYLATKSTIDISRNITGGTEPNPVTYSIQPSLPIGLSINPLNGTIFGTTVYSSISPLTTYTIDASGNSTIDSATITFSVNITPIFTFPDTPYTLQISKFSTIIPIYIVSDTFGITYTLLSSSPAYPTLTDLSLNLNFLNGSISGIPDISSNYTTYVIRANNGGVTFDASLSISVQTLPTINYSNTLYTLTQGEQVSILPLQTNNPTTVVTYNIHGCSLPFGLTFNTSTGEISGTPTILTTFREYYITITNSIGSAQAKIIINVIKVFMAPPVLADNFSTNTFLTDPLIAMRRKAEILQYKKNSSRLSKQQYYSLLAQGKGPYAKKAYGNQGNMFTTPNNTGLPQDGNTIVCNSNSIQCSLTSSSDVPGPIMNLCYNPAIPLVGYIQPNRQKVNIGFKWPQRFWQIGDNGFPVGKAGNN